MSDPTHIYYNVLDNLRKLPTKIYIYNTFILSKKMRDSLVKALLNSKTYLVELDDPRQVKEKKIP